MSISGPKNFRQHGANDNFREGYVDTNSRPERKKATDFPQELLDLLDSYVHGGIGRREFLAGAQKFATATVTAAALVEMLRPNYAWAIQVPPDGQPIILFVEHQTTGGYPKPANVISADFRRLGQLRPRDSVNFERITIDDALRLLQQQEQWLYGL